MRIGTGVILYNAENKSVLMSRRKDVPLFAHPGGHLEMFETIKECCSRELREETNVNIPAEKYHYTNFDICFFTIIINFIRIF